MFGLAYRETQLFMGNEADNVLTVIVDSDNVEMERYPPGTANVKLPLVALAVQPYDAGE